MSLNNGLLLAPLLIEEICSALGVNSRNLGVLCQSANINIFAKYKPLSLTGDEQLSDALILNARYGLHAIATSIRSNLRTMELTWTYNGARNPYNRELDFHRYYNAAPCPFMQANGESLELDIISGDSQPALFYLLMASGALANKAFSSASGISSSSPAVPSDRLAYCITAEELGFWDGGAYHELLADGTTTHLGLIIFNNNGNYVDSVWARAPLAILPQRDNDMFIIPLDGLVLQEGTYTAIYCARVVEEGHTYYLPVFNDSRYPARVPLEVGGFENYVQARLGLAASVGDNPAISITTGSNSLFIVMRLYNNGPNTIRITGGFNEKFTLVARVTGNVVDNTGNVSIDRTQTTAQLISPSSGQQVSVAPGGYIDLIYSLSNIWSNNSSTSPSRIDSGSLTIGGALMYSGTREYTWRTIDQRILTVTYQQ